MNPKKILTTLFVLFLTISLQAQFSLRLTESNRMLKQAMQEYENGHYKSAQLNAQQYIQQQISQQDISIQKDAFFLATADFYNKLSAVMLKQDSALENFSALLASTPYEALVQYGNFKLAKYLFAQQSFLQAIPFYEKTNIGYLSNAEIIQRNFELAYCYLLNNQLDKVSPLFASIKDVRGEYFSPGNYYHGVLSYYKGDYDAALKSFEALKAKEEYQEVVPFYIAELNYFKGNKEAALQSCLDYMRDTSASYYGEMSQLAGQIYYEKGDMQKAKKFLMTHVNSHQNAGNDDLFRLGYIHYKMDKTDEAISYLKKVNKNNPTIYAQALYYLGLGYLKKDEKLKAHSAFVDAVKTGNLGALTEDVMFNAAKLSVELENNEIAEQELDDFIQQFPQSTYVQDALEMRVLLAIKLKDFEQAATSLKQMGALTPSFKGLYQKVHYAQGIQLLIDGMAENAIPFFNESKKFAVNKNLVGLAEFWTAECYYRLGQYQNAMDATNRFIADPGESNSIALIRSAFLTNAYIYKHENENEMLAQEYKRYLDTAANITSTFALSKMDSVKPSYVPSHVPQVEANSFQFVYELPTQQLNFVYKPLPLTPVALSNTDGVEVRNNHIKVGVGNLTTTHVSLGYDVSDDIGEDVFLSLYHRASKSGNFLQQSSTNQLRLDARKQFTNFETQGTFIAERNVFRPYGAFLNPANLPDGFDMRNRFLDFNAAALITPSKKYLDLVEYHANVGVGAYNINSQGANWSGTELSFYLNSPFAYQLNETAVANFGIETQVNGLLGYNNNLKQKPANTSTSFIVFKPSLVNTYKDIKLDIGLHAAIGQRFNLLPNIAVTKPLNSINALAGVGVESELIANSYRQLAKLNPFISLVDLQQSRRTLYYAQLAGAFFENINYQVKFGAGNIRNLPLFVNDTITNQQFNVWYESNARVLSIQANVEYHLSFNTNAGVQFQYQPIIANQILATNYHYVPMVFNAYAKYAANDKLHFRADLFVRSMTTPLRRVSETKRTIPGAADLNLQANYHISGKWSASAELNNVLNNKYQRWINYPNFGFNALIGVVYSFDKSAKQLFTNQTGKED